MKKIYPLRLDPDVIKALKYLAVDEGKTVRQILIELIETRIQSKKIDDVNAPVKKVDVPKVDKVLQRTQPKRVQIAKPAVDESLDIDQINDLFSRVSVNRIIRSIRAQRKHDI